MFEYLKKRFALHGDKRPGSIDLVQGKLSGGLVSDALSLLASGEQTQAELFFLFEYMLAENDRQFILDFDETTVAGSPFMLECIRSAKSLFSGNPGLALKMAQDACDLEPARPEAFNHAARALLNLGHTNDAIVTFQKALEVDRSYAPAWHNLAHTYRADGQLDKAISCYQEAIVIWPKYFSALYNLAITLSLAGNHEKALSLLKMLIKEQPGRIDYRLSLGQNLHAIGSFSRAEQVYRDVLQVNPDDSVAWCYLGVLLNEQMRTTEALQSLERSLSFNPEDPDALAELVNIYEKTNRLELAQQTIDRALGCKAITPSLLIDAATVSRRMGRIQEARSIITSLDHEHLPAAKKQSALFEHAMIEDKLANYDLAYGLFEKANALSVMDPRRKKIDHNAFGRRCGLIHDWLDKRDKLKVEWPTSSQAENTRSVIFVIGFPRSGTTLLDTLLSASEEVCSIEEKPSIENLLTNIEHNGGTFWQRDSVSAFDIVNWQKAYHSILQRLQPGFEKYPFVLDKLPLRMLSAGFMSILFPEARFLFAARHPCDVVLSNFMQNYAPNEAFVHFDTLESSVDMYCKVMDLWRKIEPLCHDNLYRVHYENLVRKPAEEASRLCAFAGIEYRESMLDASSRVQSRSRIQTNSYAQVSEEIHAKSVARWRRYEKYFEPHMDRLGEWIRHFGYEQ